MRVTVGWSLIAGPGSQATRAGHGSRVAGRGSRVAGRGSRVAGYFGGSRVGVTVRGSHASVVGNGS